MKNTKDNLHNSNFSLWEDNWSYAASFYIGAGLIIVGFALEMANMSFQKINIVFPNNLYFLICHSLLLICSYYWFSQYKIIRWMLKVPASVTGIILLFFMVMIMGIIPQTPSENAIINFLGLNHITQHWSFILLLFLVLNNLGLIVIKRLSFKKWTDFGFFLNHFGLYLALMAGILGSGDIQRLSVRCFENKPQLYATDQKNNIVELPFAFYLKDFKMEEYDPKIAIVDNKTGKVIHGDGKHLINIHKSDSVTIENFTIKPLKYLPQSARVADDKYESVNEDGAVPASKVEVYNHQTHKKTMGWISCGSYRLPFESLKLDDKYSLILTVPEAKKFSSEIDILTQKGERFSTVLQVNQPYNYEGWEIYQLSYDEEMGKWSETSVIEMVKDPWLPVIYTGIFMMIAGALYLLFTGKKLKHDVD